METRGSECYLSGEIGLPVIWSVSSLAYISTICSASSSVRSGVSYREIETSLPSNEKETPAASSYVTLLSLLLSCEERSSVMIERMSRVLFLRNFCQFCASSVRMRKYYEYEVSSFYSVLGKFNESSDSTSKGERTSGIFGNEYCCDCVIGFKNYRK